MIPIMYDYAGNSWQVPELADITLIDAHDNIVYAIRDVLLTLKHLKDSPLDTFVPESMLESLLERLQDCEKEMNMMRGTRL